MEVQNGITLTFKPFKDDKTNVIDSLLLAVVGLVVFTGLLFYTSEIKVAFPDDRYSNLYDVLAFGALVGSIVYSLMVVLVEVEQRLQFEKEKLERKRMRREMNPFGGMFDNML